MNGRAADAVRRLFERALARVAPAGPVERAVAGLDLADSVVLLALGKAAAAMADGAEAALGPRVADRVVVVPAGRLFTGRAGLVEGAHPVPDARSEAAGRALHAAATRARPDQDVLALVSGGGSALAAVPAEGIALADKAAAIGRLMDAGAPIAELNAVRRHLSAIKGGRLARASRARVTTLVVSDVVGDALHEVASGPTVPDPTSFADACEVIERRVGAAAVAPSVWQRLEAGRRAHPGPTKRDDAAEGRARDRALLVLGRGALASAAADEARGHGDVEVIGEALEGEVAAIAATLTRAIDALLRQGGFLVAGGEPTVELPPGAGRSGRAHHLALLLARSFAGRAAELAILVAGSDGEDGASGAAGAIVGPATWDRIRAAGRDPERDLAGFDAAAALAAAGAQLKTGPTGVNHADLVLAWAGPARFS